MSNQQTKNPAEIIQELVRRNQDQTEKQKKEYPKKILLGVVIMGFALFLFNVEISSPIIQSYISVAVFVISAYFYLKISKARKQAQQQAQQ